MDLCPELEKRVGAAVDRLRKAILRTTTDHNGTNISQIDLDTRAVEFIEAFATGYEILSKGPPAKAHRRKK